MEFLTGEQKKIIFVRKELIIYRTTPLLVPRETYLQKSNRFYEYFQDLLFEKIFFLKFISQVWLAVFPYEPFDDVLN